MPSPQCDVNKHRPLPPSNERRRRRHIKRGDETVKEEEEENTERRRREETRGGNTTAPCLTSRCLALTASEMFFLRACHGTSGGGMRDKLRRRGGFEVWDHRETGGRLQTAPPLDRPRARRVAAKTRPPNSSHGVAVEVVKD